MLYTFTETRPASGTTTLKLVEGLNGFGPVNLRLKSATCTIFSSATSVAVEFTA